MDDADRERLERLLDAVTLAGNADEVRREIEELEHLAERARAVEDASNEAKLNKLHTILHEEGFFDNPEQRLLIFTEFRDTLNHILDRLKSWGFSTGQIHGGMNDRTTYSVGQSGEPREAIRGVRKVRSDRLVRG